MRITALPLLLVLLYIVPIYAQPVAISDLPIGSKLTYRLEGVYLGNKTYEVIGWSSSQGRKCKLVRVRLQVNASGSYFYKGINSTSYFCYDERGRPLLEELEVPPEFNLSVKQVKIYYWWSDDEVYPKRTLIQMIGQKNSSYDVLLEEGLVIKMEDGKKESIRVSKDNLSKVLPFLPERLSEPYVDISSLRLKEGFRKTYGSLNITVLSLENVETSSGLTPCYKVEIDGLTEDQTPYNSTVYITADRPRVTIQYETDITGIKQWGYLTEMVIPKSSSIPYALIGATIVAIAILVGGIAMKKIRKRKRE